MEDLISSNEPLDFASLFAPGKKPPDRAFWLTRTVEERFAAVEYLRQREYGYDPDTARVERALEIIDVSYWFDKPTDASPADELGLE